MVFVPDYFSGYFRNPFLTDVKVINRILREQRPFLKVSTVKYMRYQETRNDTACDMPNTYSKIALNWFIA